MPDAVSAIFAVIVLLFVAHLTGWLFLRSFKEDIGSPALVHLLCLVFGIGIIGVLTLLAGVTIGYSSHVIKTIYLSLAILTAIHHLVRFRRRCQGAMPTVRQLGSAEKVLLVVLSIHFVFYLLTGFSYPYGSDSFSYVLIPQEYLRLGQFLPIKLEPLQELVPIFKAPCLFELVYLNLLGMANLIAVSLFAKLQLIMSTLLAFYIACEIGGRKAGWLTIALLLTEPVIAYSAAESADNYNISTSLQIGSIYFMWLYYRTPRPALLAVAGMLGGMMVAVKLTTCYYLFAMVLLLPILVHISSKNKGAPPGRLTAIKESLAFILPALLLAGLFPLVLYIASGNTIFGFDWTFDKPERMPRETWISPFFHLVYNPLLRYKSIFEVSPDFPLYLAKVKALLSYYLRNPLKVLSYPDWQYSHTPLSLLLVVVVPLAVTLMKRFDPYLRWVAAVLLGAYCIKLANYPLVIPPKSEIFQIVPAAILTSVCLVRYMSEAWKINAQATRSTFFIRVVGILRNPAHACLLLLIPFVINNMFYVNAKCLSLITKYSFRSQEQMAANFKQQWFVNNLTSHDVLFGMVSNQLCYIRKPEIRQFFWQSMLFVPWTRIQQRIISTKANYFFDDSTPPAALRGNLHLILPIISRRNPTLHGNLVTALDLYERNYLLKTKFLQQYFDKVHQDGTAIVYKKKKTLMICGEQLHAL